MALGDGKGNSNGGKKLFENQYYSRIGFKQYNEKDTKNNDKRLGISYKSGMMILEISRAKEGGFEYESLISVYITATKAKIFGKEIDEAKYSNYPNYPDVIKFLTGKSNENSNTDNPSEC